MQMPHPQRRAKSGFYAARKAIPKHLQEIVERRHGRRMVEFWENLETRDKAEAIRKSRPIFERFDAYLQAAEAEYRGTQDRLTDHEVSVLCGRWLADREAASRHDLSLTLEQHEEAVEFYGDHLRAFDGDDGGFSPQELVRDLEAETGPLLAAIGRSADPDSRQRLARRLARVAWEWHRSQVERATTGRRAPTVTSQDFPAAPQRGRSTGTTMDDLLAGWAADRGWRLDTKPCPRPLYDRVRTMERLAAFLGHRDAGRVDKAAVVRWKAEMQARGVTASTVRNDLSEMSAIWKRGVTHEAVAENPFAGLSPPKAKRRKREVRPFTREEAARVLEARSGRGRRASMAAVGVRPDGGAAGRNLPERQGGRRDRPGRAGVADPR